MILASIAFALWLWMTVGLVKDTQFNLRQYAENVRRRNSGDYHYWPSYESHSKWEAVRDNIGWFVAGTLALSGAAFGIMAIISNEMSDSSLRAYHHSSTDLRAMSASSDAHGSFFLASGYVDDRQVFRYIFQDENGGNRLDSIWAGYAVVYEDSEQGGTMVRSWGTPKSLLWTFVPAEMDLAFHVPTGSVKDGYEMAVSD